MSKHHLLPKLTSGVRRTVSKQTVFGGLAGRVGATGDKIGDMLNMTSEFYPAMSVRNGWRRMSDLFAEDAVPNGIFYYKQLYVVCDKTLYRVLSAGIATPLYTQLSDTPKSMTAFNEKLYIFPDGVIVDLQTEAVSLIDVDIRLSSGVTFEDCDIVSSDYNFQANGFSAGDGVVVTVYGTLEGVKETHRYTVLSVSGKRMTLDGKPTMSGVYWRIQRSAPALEGVCVAQNRMWGFQGKNIYACAEGNGCNWLTSPEEEALMVGRTEGDPVILSTSSAGNVLACAAWRDYAIFLKEEYIGKVLCHGAGRYELAEIHAVGVTSDTRHSVCEAEGRLYYASSRGVYAYDGGYPQRIATPWETKMSYASGGSDGRRYYLSCGDEEGKTYTYIYDIDCDAWYKQDETYAMMMTSAKNHVYMVDNACTLIYTDGAWGKDTFLQNRNEYTLALHSMVEFCDEIVGIPDGVRLHKLYLSCKSEEGSSMAVFVAYDGEKDYSLLGTVSGARDGWVELVVPVVRCRYYRLKLDMLGPWRIYALHKEYEMGRQR